MEIVNKKLSEIKPYEKNPRKNDDAVKYVAKSIEEFGFKVPIVIDRSGVIVAGHTRYKAASSLGMKEVPCIIADDLTDEQIKAFRLADNKVGEIAEWDDSLLGDELDGIFDLDMGDFGFVFDTPEDDAEVQEDDFDADIPEEPRAKLGDIYRLGRHRLMCGDSTILTDIEKLAGGVLADMLLTDPPYNVDYEGKTKDKLKIQNDNRADEDFREFLREAMTNAYTVMKPGAVFYVWHADSEGLNFRQACKDAGFKVRQCLIWKKNTLVLGRQDYQWQHEPCLYGWKEGAGHLWASDRRQTTILEFDRPIRSELHPTMKPVALFDYQIKNNTKGGDIVLDLFGGSGTTIMACEQNGRTAYMMEYDPRYVDVIIDRWEKFTGEKAVLIREDGDADGETTEGNRSD